MNKLLTVLLTLPLLSFAAPTESRVPLADPVLTVDNTVVMNDVFTGDSVAKVIKTCRDLDFRSSSSEPIYLIINSPGGSIMAGLELIENLSALNRPVKTINLFSASMGFQTAQGLGERLITKHGTLMSHKAAGTFSGEFPGQLDSRYGYILKIITKMDQNAADRTKGKHSLESYRNLTENEYWCDGQDCVDQGFADRVVSPKCDKSLSGTVLKTLLDIVFMGVPIKVVGTFDACPMNTNPLSIEVQANGKSIQDPTNVINPEVRFEIEKRVNEAVDRIFLKEVIKGY